ncbi:MAG TPA: hypothetical protein VFA90_07035 [Terriglobales bacterium]|nr:hypothetical protein [Terriglobales bacterium]
MIRNLTLIAGTVLLVSVSAFSQKRPIAPAPENQDEAQITVRGCVRSERGNYILIENRTGAIYALQGVGSRLQRYLRKEVEVTGESKIGSVKTGMRPDKTGSNPSDTVHGVDGVPLQVKNIEKDIRIISQHCKAADQQ